MVAEWLQVGAAGVTSEASHPVVLTAVLAAWLKVHRIRRVDGWILIKVVVGPQQDPTPIAHRYGVGDILGMRDVEESGGHPGNKVLQTNHD